VREIEKGKQARRSMCIHLRSENDSLKTRELQADSEDIPFSSSSSPSPPPSFGASHILTVCAKENRGRKMIKKRKHRLLRLSNLLDVLTSDDGFFQRFVFGLSQKSEEEMLFYAPTTIFLVLLNFSSI
jgi:hypothetical protein